jgi:hypothetical protein
MPHTLGLSTWLLLALIILVWPVFFGGLWTVILMSMSFVGGWRRLARQYRATRPAEGRRVIRGATGMVGLTSYNKVLNLTVADDGLFATPFWMFRIGHPALFIPWRDIRNASRGRTFYWDYVAFNVGDPKIASMRLPSDVFDGTPVFIDA